LDKALIRKVVCLYRRKFSDLVVVSGGCPTGADHWAKEVALEEGVGYLEFAPAHHVHNPYCAKPASEYNRPYDVRNFFARNSEIAQYCDHVLGFVVPKVRHRGTSDTLSKAMDLGRMTFVYSSSRDTSAGGKAGQDEHREADPTLHPGDGGQVSGG
jgi:hypothetical protein